MLVINDHIIFIDFVIVPPWPAVRASYSMHHKDSSHVWPYQGFREFQAIVDDTLHFSSGIFAALLQLVFGLPLAQSLGFP